MATASAASSAAPMTREEKKVIFASSLGTVFEWYDFYLYGTLVAIIGKHFFTALDPASRDIFVLLGFAAGFLVRPFGALVFGRLGDMIGRKYTFLVTILIMGLSTFLVGFLPTYNSVGMAAPVALIALRMLQGLALGGEYGGAATYVAEHAPQGKRGAFTSWIQTTATLGLFLSILVILGTRTIVGEEAFGDWGWRIPFVVSALLLAVSVWIRLSMNESPAFKKMKSEGKTSKAPLSESFGQWKNLKIVLLALFGLTMGQAVVWYTGQFYALYFLTGPLKLDGATSNILIAISLAIGTPFFIVFGSLSDKIGRKPIIMAGCLIAALTFMPLFKALTAAVNPDLAAAQAASKVVVTADPAECSFQFNPTGTAKFTSSCDIAKQKLSASSVSYDNVAAATGTPATISVGDKVISTAVTPEEIATAKAAAEAKLADLKAAAAPDAKAIKAAEANVKTLSDAKTAKDAVLSANLKGVLKSHGYPDKADPEKINKPMAVLILVVLVLFVTMVYGPIAAMLVEMFPTRIRYTSMSLPYHIGNGWFGGLLPAMGVAIVAQTGNMYNGLWYPIAFASITFVVGMLFVKETKDRDIYAND